MVKLSILLPSGLRYGLIISWTAGHVLRVVFSLVRDGKVTYMSQKEREKK